MELVARTSTIKSIREEKVCEYGRALDVSLQYKKELSFG